MFTVVSFTLPYVFLHLNTGFPTNFHQKKQNYIKIKKEADRIIKTGLRGSPASALLAGKTCFLQNLCFLLPFYCADRNALNEVSLQEGIYDHNRQNTDDSQCHSN